MHMLPPRGAGLADHGPPRAAGHPSGLDIELRGIKWDGTDAVITLRVPLMVASCKREEHDVNSSRPYIYLKTKVRVAA